MANEALSEGAGSRALVPLAPGPGAAAPPRRALAGFVTQLLACEASLPAYRARRCAPPAEASLRYGAAPAAREPARIDRAL